MRHSFGPLFPDLRILGAALPVPSRDFLQWRSKSAARNPAHRPKMGDRRLNPKS
jgi:hypothetical protein